MFLDPQDMSYNFNKYAHGEADYYGEPYDFDSLMHYENNAFSNNGRSTIVANGSPNKKLGQRNGFSPIDIKQLNKLYGCKGTGTGTGGGSGGLLFSCLNLLFMCKHVLD